MGESISSKRFFTLATGFMLALVMTTFVACERERTAKSQADGTSGEISQHILDLENKWAQVDVTNDRSIFDEIIAPDFYSTSSRTGKRKNRAEWLADWEYEGVRSAQNIDAMVQVFSDTLAVHSGIDETKGINEDGSEWVHQDICTDTWLKRNGRWQCIAAQCSRIK